MVVAVDLADTCYWLGGHDKNLCQPYNGLLIWSFQSEIDSKD
tara:strand:+ start:379 stop:504 length:126 start_codon:yes stop_codon:yes gene_type:complete